MKTFLRRITHKLMKWLVLEDENVYVLFKKGKDLHGAKYHFGDILKEPGRNRRSNLIKKTFSFIGDDIDNYLKKHKL